MSFSELDDLGHVAALLLQPARLDPDRALDEHAMQTQIDKRLNNDPTFSSLGITATVLDAKVTLLGTVKTQELKDQVERMVKQIKGVKSVDNQITVL